MLQERINKLLAKGDSELEKKVVETVRSYVRTSQSKMSAFYGSWDNNANIYRGYRLLDREDRDSIEKKEPAKIIVPITYAQTQTAIAFLLSSYTQKEKFYELRSLGPEDVKHAFALEADIQHQLTRNNFYLILYNLFLDAMKCGFGVIKCDWHNEFTRMRVLREEPISPILSFFQGITGHTPPTRKIESVEKILSYEGCRLRNISPYSFLPDPSVTLARFQEGLFVGHEEEVSRTSLTMEEGETYFGTDKMPTTLPNDSTAGRTRRAGKELVDSSIAVSRGSPKTSPKVVLKTEVEFSLVPGDWTKEFGLDFGSSRDPVKWIAVLANESKLIRFEPTNYLHGHFNYAVAEWSPDHTDFYNPGLADTILELQNLVTFFLNSHVANVKKTIQNRFIGNPAAIHMEDIKEGSMFIRLRDSAVGSIDRAIKQLEVTDVTREHVRDVDVLAKLVQLVTGINENALGQYSGGRRSATEARNVNAGAAARLKMHASLAWAGCLEPLGRQILSNTRQGRTKEFYEAIVGNLALESPYEEAILTTPSKIAGGLDFVPYDGTLPSDRQQQAAVLTELFTVLISNPAAIQLLQKNPAALLEHIAKLHNIQNLRDFDLAPQPGSLSPPIAQLTPDHKAMDMVDSGMVEPVDISGAELLNSLTRER